MTRTKKHRRNFINFITSVEKMVIPFLDVSGDKQTTTEKQNLKPENKTNNNRPNQQLKNARLFFHEQPRLT